MGRGSAKRPVVSVGVGLQNLAEDVEVVACLMCSEVGRAAALEGRVEALNERRFLIAIRNECWTRSFFRMHPFRFI